LDLGRFDPLAAVAVLGIPMQAGSRQGREAQASEVAAVPPCCERKDDGSTFVPPMAVRILTRDGSHRVANPDLEEEGEAGKGRSMEMARRSRGGLPNPIIAYSREFEK
jgi:hypothetical protein